MKGLKTPKILFFTKTSVPSAAEKIEALDLGVPVQWRNSAAHVEGEVEPCDGVLGSVPKCYKAKKVKSATTAIKSYRDSLKALMSGDEKAPTIAADDEDENEDKDGKAGSLQNGGAWPGTGG
jgi:hypothetical protein